MITLAERLQRGPTDPLLLDGGGATTLEASGESLDPALWSAGCLIDAPDAIRRCHAAFLSAGAEVATTMTYQASFEGFARRGLEAAEARRVMASGVRLAREAGAEVTHQTFVAGSVGSYGGVLADGSEFRGGFGLSVDRLVDFHRPRLEACGAGADVVACETVPELDEVRAFARLAEDAPVPVWISVTLRDGAHLRSGESLREAFDIVADSAAVAFALNCSAPAHVTAALELLPSEGLPIFAYANSGEGYVDGAWSGDRGPRPFIAFVGDWLDRGAAGVGGCCRVTPDDIRDMADLLARR